MNGLITKPTRSASPLFEPVTLAEAKKQVELPTEYTAHDGHLSDLISVAREQLEHDTGMVFASGTFTWLLSQWPECGQIEFPVRPVSSITSITYVDSAGSTQTWSSANYALNTQTNPPRVYLKYGSVWPTHRAYYDDITITFVAGYSTALLVPKIAKQAILIQVARLFHERIGELDGKNLDNTYEMLIRRLQRTSYP